NIDVLKFCLYPLLIAESAYRKRKQKIDFVHVTNADHLAQHSPEFIGVARHLDLVRDSKVSFVGRYDTPQFLVEHTDIVVSNQWGLALNYFYFDVCWNGYALVHNAHLCKEIGYYYPNNDVDEGTRRLIEAIEHHNDDWQGYLKRQRELIGRFLSTNPDSIAAYDKLLLGLFDTTGKSTEKASHAPGKAMANH
ncbi:DUF2827 family protein, partial [Burkholderia ubonensis]|uniref:DUF2827 family protein n=1 Tax=Burkholderia ubonensis TaxID=101571 RepID=UPI000AB36C09